MPWRAYTLWRKTEPVSTREFFMGRKSKKFWEDILEKDKRERKRIEKAVREKDVKFFEDWFDRYTHRSKKDDWL